MVDLSLSLSRILNCRTLTLFSRTRFLHYSSGKSEEELYRDVDEFVEKTGMHDIHDLLKKAALVAQDKSNFDRLPQLDDEERRFLREETVSLVDSMDRFGFSSPFSPSHLDAQMATNQDTILYVNQCLVG